jgi:hypothetical protein
MPADLLRGLETAGPVVGSLENVADLVRVVARELSGAVEGMQGSAGTFENAWRRIVVEVATGKTAEMQAVRQRLLDAFEKRLSLLRQAYELASWLSKLGRADVPNPEIVRAEIAGMERLKATVFERWQSPEDLEDLAARDYPLTTADLDRLGPHRRPASSWYTEESKPF